MRGHALWQRPVGLAGPVDSSLQGLPMRWRVGVGENEEGTSTSLEEERPTPVCSASRSVRKGCVKRLAMTTSETKLAGSGDISTVAVMFSQWGKRRHLPCPHQPSCHLVRLRQLLE